MFAIFTERGLLQRLLWWINQFLISQRCRWVFKSGCASSNVVGIICLPLVGIGFTELPNAHPAHLLTAYTVSTHQKIEQKILFENVFNMLEIFVKQYSFFKGFFVIIRVMDSLLFYRNFTVSLSLQLLLILLKRSAK